MVSAETICTGLSSIPLDRAAYPEYTECGRKNSPIWEADKDQTKKDIKTNIYSRIVYIMQY
jgi:hypothetical protein